MPFVYGSFAFTVWLGRWLRRSAVAARDCGGRRERVGRLLRGHEPGRVARGDLYPRTLDGLATCYIAAIPFFRNTLAGDAATPWRCSGFALAQRYVPSLDERRTPVLGSP